MAERQKPETSTLAALDAALGLASFFVSFEPGTLETFLPSLAFRRYAAGEAVVHEGEQGGEFYVLLQGSLSVRKKRTAGEQQEIAALAPGDSFGEVSMMSGTRRTASIVASEPSLLASVSTRDLQKVIEREPDVGERLEAQARARLSETRRSGRPPAD